jgi:hypothetical protein
MRSLIIGPRKHAYRTRGMRFVCIVSLLFAVTVAGRACPESSIMFALEL